jgi:hypothetical protein
VRNTAFLNYFSNNIDFKSDILKIMGKAGLYLKDLRDHKGNTAIDIIFNDNFRLEVCFISFVEASGIYVQMWDKI